MSTNFIFKVMIKSLPAFGLAAPIHLLSVVALPPSFGGG